MQIRWRPEGDRVPIPGQSTIYREIARRSPYEIMAARYGKRRAGMEFRVSGAGPDKCHALQRVSIDHTPSDIIVVDERSMLPLGRPTVASALMSTPVLEWASTLDSSRRVACPR
jgi:putative transposase